MKYNVLLLGSGGRENAIAWKLSQSENLEKLYCMPGNPGMEKCGTCLKGSPEDFEGVRACVMENKIDLVVVGPEAPLVKGLRDFLKADSTTAGVLFVGPDKSGARLEGSKDFAKGFMSRHRIPTARYRSFTAAEKNDAVSFLKELKPPYVLKADGLAAGKGVLIIDSLEEAVSSLDEMFGGKFGSAGSKVVIEEYLTGIECSVFILTDGMDYMLLPEAKDYKRIYDGDKGPNTGGMGAVSPVPFADATFMRKVEERILRPTVDGLREEGIDYRGFIFAGLMNCGGEPYVIEYNARMGDPETESVMPRITSDLLSHLVAAAKGSVKDEKLTVSSKTALTVVSVSGGYPDAYQKGFTISGLDDLKDVITFHSGTVRGEDGSVRTNGGRVLATVALGDDLISLRKHLYGEISKLSFEGMAYRKDIGADVLGLK